LENIPRPPGWISADVIWGENVNRRREKEGKCKRKRKTVEEKKGSKSVK
jgi:hypothetical protein